MGWPVIPSEPWGGFGHPQGPVGGGARATGGGSATP
jgi:hypothetical protein